LTKEEKQIEDFMYQYINNTDKEIRINIFNELIAFGNKGIDAINDLIKVTGSDELIVYGLGLIQKAKES
jgi:hypothetical protein